MRVSLATLALPRVRMNQSPLATVRVWDLPTRLFHWTLAACVIGSVVSAKVGGNAMVWHFRLGYVVLSLLAFRLVWGLIGGRWSRFASFVHAPSTLKRYLAGRHTADEHLDVGHNPLGALSVLAMLGLLAAQVSSGLFADDDISNTGPLVKFVSGSTSSLLTSWHKQFGQWLILALVALHVAAIAVYFWRKQQNLVAPMLSGDKTLPASVPPARDGTPQRLLALAVLLACAAGVAALVSLGG
jgi:cytochrome b